MKKAIRTNIFETNSSSTHTISISRNFDATKYKFPKTLVFRGVEFGWEVEIYDDVVSRCRYLYTAMCSLLEGDALEEKKKYIEDVLQKHGVVAAFDEFKYYDDGYIDHCEDTRELLNYVFKNENNLLNYLFGDTLIYTSNDNMDWEDKPEIREGDYEEIYKGN